MARAHVEFLQAQSLDWQPTPFAHLAGTQHKLLSRDEVTGACSLLLRLPAGWQHEGCWHLDAEEEFLVLDGHLSIGEHDYEPDCYALLPRYWTREQVTISRDPAPRPFLPEALRARHAQPRVPQAY
jgi:hypothetical protein